MKRFLLSLIVYGCITVSIFGQSGWTWVNPKPEGNQLYDVAICGASYAVAVGELGLILRSTDNGEHWTKISSGTKVALNSVSIAENGTGWIVGLYGTVLKTTDFGLTWSPQSTGNSSFYYSVITPDGVKCYIGVSNGRLIKSADGGETWTLTSTNSTKHVRCVFTDGSGVIFLAQDGGVIQKSSDNGTTWSIKSTGITNALSKISFLGNLGFALGTYGKLLRSTDSGDTWTLVTINTTSSLADVLIIDANHVLISYYDNFLRSSDGGITFTKDSKTPWRDSSLVYAAISALAMKPNNYYLAVGLCGWSYKSVDTTNWTLVTEGYQIGGFTAWFTDINKGFAAGTDGVIYKTIDGGNSWTSVTDRLTWGYLNILYFKNPNLGFALANTEVFRTSNGGNSWTKVLSYETTPALKGYIGTIYFVDTNFGWFTTSEGQIWRTSNGGLSWSMGSVSGTPLLTGVWFADQRNGIATGWHGVVLNTNDGGVTWKPVNCNITNDFYSLHAFDLQNLIAVAGDKCFRSSDGGTTWTEVTLSYFMGNIYQIIFVNNTTGWISGQYGAILKTTDGGVTWATQVSNTTQGIVDLSFIDENNGWASTGGGGLIRTTNGGISGTDETSIRTETDYKLFQNYPNPFINTTTLTYYQPTRTPVKIEIFDLLGSKIRTLVDQEKDPGKHQVKFDGSGLPAGIYFCRCTWGSNSSSAIKLLKN